MSGPSEATTVPPSDPQDEARTATRWLWAQHLVLALVSFTGMLTTAPGWVAADTKSYLYLDPGRLLSRAGSLWDPNVALGTVTHQNIGYLWPMGPWFWVFDQLGAPVWVAQRLWMATLLLAAGAGVLHLVRALGWGRPHPAAALAAAALYAFSPYVLDYAARISVLLLPWAGLPWMIALTHRSLRTGSWRHPALFALLVLSVGGTNATSLVLVGLGPLLWVGFAVWVHREVQLRAALAAVARIGVLSLAVSAWWIAGLVVQGGWGLDVLRYTETVETVARSSLASEVLRGLGYWFFYGTDKLGPWIEPGRTFTESPALILTGFAAPVLAVAAVVATRWRYRAYAVGLVLVGTVVAVGAYPYRDPSPLGELFKTVATSSTVGLALRSTARAVPLVCLGIALAVGSGLAALAGRWPRWGTGAALAVVGLAVAANPPLWTGGFVGDNLRRPEDLPDYWVAAAAALDREGPATRVLELPGSDFATYRWGNTVDPITPGLLDRPVVARELIPFGSEPSADLLIAFDRRLQEGVLDAEAVVPVARLMGAGDILVRSDLEYERYRVTRPRQVWRLLSTVPAGLGRPVGFGEPVENRAAAALPMLDEIHLATRGVPDPSPVTVLPVTDPLPIVRLRSAASPMLLSGDGEGMVEAAAAGVLDGDGVVLYAAALADRPTVLRQALDAGAHLVVTDTNRKRAMRWGTVRDNDGYTERANETPLRDDPSDNRLPVFPHAGVEAFTTVEQRGVARVDATAYGNPVTYTPGERPSLAFDGDLSTAWAVGSLGPVGGHRLLVEAEAPVSTDHVEVVQAYLGPRVITRLGVDLDGERVTEVTLDGSSFEPGGQRIELGRTRTFTTLELVVEADNVGRQPRYDDQNGVGLAEVSVAGLRVDEVVHLPTDLLTAAGPASLDHALTLVLARLRADPTEPFARDQEAAIARSVTLPAGRTFRLSGLARIDGRATGQALDQVLGLRVAGVAAANSSGRLPGVPAARASSAVDGDPATAWTNHFGPQEGAWLDLDLDATRTIDRLELVVVADGEHSVPTRLRIVADGGAAEQTVVVPPIVDRPTTAGGATVAVPVALEPIRGRSFRVIVEEVRPVTTIDWFSTAPIAMPVAIAELGLAGTGAVTRAVTIDTCRDDVLTVDGRRVWLRVSGSASAAEQRGSLTVTTCGPDAAGVALGAGTHELRAAPTAATALDLDRLVLDSAPGGLPAPALPRAPAGPQASSTHEVTVRSSGRTSFDLRVAGDGPVWLLLGQSWSPGWQARAGGRDLGEPVVADGYANGWLVDPGPDGVVDVTLRWTPQRLVVAGLGVSAVGVLGCLALVVAPARRRRPGGSAAPLPGLRASLWRSGPPARWAATAAATVGLGIAAGAVVHPLVGAGIAVVTLLAVRLPLGRGLALVGAVGGVAAAGAFTALKQLRNDYPADFGWTDFFRPAHLLAWTGLACLAVVLATDRLRGPAPDPTGAPSAGGQPADAPEAPAQA